MIDLTEVVLAVCTLCGVIVTARIIPLIKANVSKANLDKAIKWTGVAVNAAEKLADKGSIRKEDKYKYVEEFLEKRGFTLDISEVEALIEGAVNQLPTLLECQYGDTINPMDDDRK